MTDTELQPKRRARKTVTPEEEAAQILLDNGISAEEMTEAAPVKKPRASRKKTDTAEATAETPAETEKPKRSRSKKPKLNQ